MLRPLAAFCAVGSALLATGCASIVSGHNQSLSVQALSGGKSVQGATCTLSNDKGTWYVTTPGSTVVNRSFAELSVKCEKSDYESGFTSVKSSTKAMAFGNILFGGVIGAGVDMATGAAYDYPNDISIVMMALGTGNAPATAPVPPAASSTAAPAVASASLEKAEYLVYRVTDRLTRVERRVRVPVNSRTLAGTGDMELLSPPGGWMPDTASAGSNWTLKYAARDGSPASQLAVTGQAGAPTMLRTGAGEFEAVPVTYKGWIQRVMSGTFLVSQPAEFRLWLHSGNKRVLRFESDIPFRSAGSNQARASQEHVELVKLASGRDDDELP
jgi:hypothetical protein